MKLINLVINMLSPTSSYNFFKQYGVRIEIIYGEEPKDAYQELVEDLLAIVTSFAGKLYGMRGHRKKKLVQGFKKLLEEVEKE